jgi:hypothetical protein
MAKRMSTELTDDALTNENEKMDQEQQDKCGGIGKCADMEDKKTRSLSHLLRGHLAQNLFSTICSVGRK